MIPNNNRKKHNIPLSFGMVSALKKDELKRAILKYLRTCTVGATISDISRDLGVSRPTVYKYLSELKAENLIKEIAIGAYRIYMPREKFLNEVKMISKKLLCALANSLHQLFGDEALKISYRLGGALVNSFFDLYPEELEKLGIVKEVSPFGKLRFVLDIFLGKEIKLNIIELEKTRCILLISGKICEDIPTTIIIQFLKGAMKRFIEVITANTLFFSSENIKKLKNVNYEITIEMILVKNTNK